MRSVAFAAVGGALVVALAMAGGIVQAQTQTERLFVTVRESSGTPIRNLSAADFDVIEDGQRRQGIKVRDLDLE